MAYSSDFLVRTVMSAASGLPEDRYVNDWAFRWFGSGFPAPSDYAALTDAIDVFYNGGSGAPNIVASYIGSSVNRSATHEIEVYALAAGPLGSPVFTTGWLGPAAPATTSNLPTECAAVLSFHADLTGVLEESGATRPRARRRGRVYVGPLAANALDHAGNTGAGAAPAPALASVFLDAMRTQANAMGDAAEAASFTWRVWSRTDATTRLVVGGWTDNAPDTQRRRGQAATARVTFSR